MEATPDEERDLLSATRDLSKQVGELAKHVSISKDQADRTERQVRRTKGVMRLMIAVVIIVLLGLGLTTVALIRIGNITDQNKHNAVVNCQNANESRRASLSLWTFVLDASAANNPDQTPQQKELSAKFRAWVERLYAPRDCSDLGREYDLPPPPSIN